MLNRSKTKEPLGSDNEDKKITVQRNEHMISIWAVLFIILSFLIGYYIGTFHNPRPIIEYKTHVTQQQQLPYDSEPSELQSKPICPVTNYFGSRLDIPRDEIEVKRVDFPESFAEFFNQYVSQSIPVIFKNGAKHWPAFNKWTDKYFNKKLGKKYFEVDISSGGDSVFEFYGDDWTSKPNMTFKEFTKRCVSPGKLKYYIAAQKIVELEEDMVFPSFAEGLRLTDTLVWMGCGGQITPAHPDRSENLMALVRGVKEFLLFHPSDREYLYPISYKGSPVISSSIPDLGNVDLNRYPLFVKARMHKVTLRAGEMLYLPAFWWHQVTSYQTNIAVNYWFKPHSLMLEDIFVGLDDKVGNTLSREPKKKKK